jgi:UDP-N-acetylmuramoyl-L-alanyl-D-glutamate--2,6-diaminopimelate ligase
MRPVLLSELAERLQVEGLLLEHIGDDVQVTGAADDSRAVGQGDLFCAWRGTHADSHDFVAGAAHRGAVAALVERPVGDVDLPQLAVRNGRRAAAVAASRVFGDPQDQLGIVGVTGTNGKTTSVWILRHMLSLHEPTASLGTLGVILEDGSVLPDSESLTTPGPVQLARTLRLLVDRGVARLAMEVSSHALDQGRVHTLRFDSAVFTNLSRDHLDYHGTVEAYSTAKRSLVRLLSAEGCAVINMDDPAWDGLAAAAPRALTFGTRDGAHVQATNIRYSAFGVTFDVRTSMGNAEAHLPLPGAFNVQNALGAVAACLSVGFTVAEAASALAEVPQVPGRLERIAAAPCTVIRDYAHTPDALERVLGALRPLTTGRIVTVFGAGGDRDSGKRPLMGELAQRLSDVAIVTSDNPRTEDPDRIIDDIVAGMGDGGYVRITDRREAIAEALRIAQPQDIVLLAGKGHETYQIIGTEKQSFDERAVVGELVAAKEAQP